MNSAPNEDDLARFIAWLRAQRDPHETAIVMKVAEIAAAHPDWPAALVRQQAGWWVYNGTEPPAPDRAAWGLE